MGLRRGYKRDGRGRFATVGGSKGKSVAKRSGKKRSSAVSSHKAARRAIAAHKRAGKPKLTAAEARARHKKIVRNVNIARAAIIVGAAGAAAYDLHSNNQTGLGARRAHAYTMGQRISRANSHGLGAMMIAKQSRRGVYKVTSL